MARPRKINPNGATRRMSAEVAEPVARRIEREAARRGVSIAQVVREILTERAA
jgi:hypothetical protein